MPIYRISHTQLITKVYVIDADTEEEAQDLITEECPAPANEYLGGDMDERIETGFATFDDAVKDL